LSIGISIVCYPLYRGQRKNKYLFLFRVLLKKSFKCKWWHHIRKSFEFRDSDFLEIILPVLPDEYFNHIFCSYIFLFAFMIPLYAKLWNACNNQIKQSWWQREERNGRTVLKNENGYSNIAKYIYARAFCFLTFPPYNRK